MSKNQFDPQNYNTQEQDNYSDYQNKNFNDNSDNEFQDGSFSHQNQTINTDPSIQDYSQQTEKGVENFAQQIPQFNPHTQQDPPQRKSNKPFFIIATLLILVLGALSGGLYWYNFMRDEEKEEEISEQRNNEQENKEEEIVVDVEETGGDLTPATNSRVYKKKTPPAEWLKQHFLTVTNALNSEGGCITDSICGANADYDNDGLTNVYEYNFNTDPNIVDSDSDGIDDGDELFVYYTNPRSKDSDGDGKKDAEEIYTCYNPTKMTLEYSTVDLKKLENNIIINQLHDTTRQTLLANGATQDDVDKLGYIDIICNAEEEAVEDGDEDGEASTDDSDTTTDSNVDT